MISDFYAFKTKFCASVINYEIFIFAYIFFPRIFIFYFLSYYKIYYILLYEKFIIFEILFM